MNPRALRGSGGVGFLIKDTLLIEYRVKVVDGSVDDTLWLQLINKTDETNSFHVCSCYLPPEQSARGNKAEEVFEQLLSNLHQIADSNPIIICGDFNARIGNKTENNNALQNRTSIDKTINSHGKNLMTFLEDSDSCIVNGRITPRNDNFTCTRLGKSVVDYIITPVETLNYIKEMKVETPLDIIDKHKIPLTVITTKLPDHSYLSCIIEISIYHRDETSPINIQQTTTDVIWPNNKFKRYKTKEIPEELYKDERLLESIRTTANTTHPDINKTYSTLIKGINSAMETHLKPIPNNTNSIPRKKKQPFWNEELTKAYKETREAEKNFLKKKENRTKIELREKRELYHLKRNFFDKQFRTAERKYLAERRNHINNLNTTQPKDFWAEINKLGPRKNTRSDFRTKNEDGNLETNGKDVLKKWADEFSKLYNTPGSDEFNQIYLEQISEALEIEDKRQMADIEIEETVGDIFVGAARKNGRIINPEELNSKITMGEVLQTTNSAKNGKSPGIDSIPNEILKSNITHKALLKIFNMCLDEGKAPDEWSKSIITPIHKQGKDKNEPLSYRGISLMSTIAKLFTSILNNRIKLYLETNHLLADEQNGFRTGRSCQEHIFVLNSIIRNRNNENKATFACFIDMAKAFDSVNHILLWDTMIKFGIQGKIHNIIRNMYSNIQACVSLDGHHTEWFRIHGGVRQGDNLAPTLFAMFINSLAENIKEKQNGVKLGDVNLPILLYADDIVIMSETEEGLQEQLDNINEWTRKNRMLINMDKTKVIHFRKSRKPLTTKKFKIGGNTVEKCDSYKYLGLEITEKLNQEKPIEALTKSASKALGNLISKYRNAKGLHFETYCKLYNSTIIPILHYSAEVWGYKEHPQINRIHERAIRMYLGVTKKTPIPSLYCESGWKNTKTHRKIEMITFWVKMYNMDEHRITKK